MSKLKENLQAIAAEKAKIKADDLPFGTSLFGVEGKLSVEDNMIGRTGDRISKYNVPGEGELIKAEYNMQVDYLLRKNTRIELYYNQLDLATAIGLTPDQIIAGNNILGIEGTGNTDIPFDEEAEYAECLALTNDILGIGGNE